jgi:hypothetical protein
MTAHPPSIVAERAVRYLDSLGRPASSVRLARELLSLTVADEAHATVVLNAAFANDTRLVYDHGAWRRIPRHVEHDAEAAVTVDDGADLAFVLVEGERAVAGAPFTLTAVVACRRKRGEIVAACGGELQSLASGAEVRDELRALLDGARIVLHAPPGGLAALENWIGDPLVDPLPLALLARRRLPRPAPRTTEEIAAALGLAVRVGDDPASRVELLPACFDALRKPGETWSETMGACHAATPGLPWSRYAFSRDDLRSLPPAPGTYRFFDFDDKLLYVGKSKNLKRRLAAWFGDQARHGARSRAILEAVHRFEARPSGSELTALLREAAAIRREAPAHNVQRQVHASRRSRPPRLQSILILEPAEDPWILRAWLIREGTLLDSVPLGPKGGGLRRIERILRDEFFDPQAGPRSGASKPIDVEIVARWLSLNRDKAVAFDPTHLKSVDDVIVRLRWFLDNGALSDPEGSPILPR